MWQKGAASRDSSQKMVPCPAGYARPGLIFRSIHTAVFRTGRLSVMAHPKRKEDLKKSSFRKQQYEKQLRLLI